MLYENCRNWVRIVVKILSQDLIENPNALIETGLSFNIYCKGRFIASITPPPMQGVYWDIGAIKPDTGDFIETNVLVWENIENPICHLNDFQSLIYYI